jgi:hypothetical protein
MPTAYAKDALVAEGAQGSQGHGEARRVGCRWRRSETREERVGLAIGLQPRVGLWAQQAIPRDTVFVRVAADDLLPVTLPDPAVEPFPPPKTALRPITGGRDGFSASRAPLRRLGAPNFRIQAQPRPSS